MSDNRQPPPEVYVDSLEGVLLGYPNSKLRFTTVDPTSEVNQTKTLPKLTLVIPTGVLIQMNRLMLETIQTNKAALRTKMGEISEQIATLIAEEPVPSAKPEKPKPK